MFEWLFRLFRRTPAVQPTPSLITLPAETLRVVEEIPVLETTKEQIVETNASEAVQEEPELLFDKSVFYAHLRTSLFRSGLKTNQVKGIDALLLDMYGRPKSWIAYALATALHETNRNMKPNTENMNYSVQGLLNTFGRHRISEADARRLGRQPNEGPLSAARQRSIANLVYGGEWGRRNLGNTEENDGWNFRGRGMDHCTGRRNYLVTGQDIGVDLIANPEKLLVLENAVKALHLGMVSGRYVPGHSFARHLPNSTGTRAQFREARRIINGVDKADLLAGYALDFQNALDAAGYNK